MGMIMLYEDFDNQPSGIGMVVPKRPKNTGMNWIRQEKRLAIYIRDGLKCVYCLEDPYTMKERGSTLTLDHVNTHISAMRAGEKADNNETNLVTSCSTCNSSRQDMDINKFVDKISSQVGQDPSVIMDRITKNLAAPLNMRTAKELIIHKGSTLAVIMSRHPALSLEESVSTMFESGAGKLLLL